MSFPDLVAVSASSELQDLAQQLKLLLRGREMLQRKDIKPRMFIRLLPRLFLVDVLSADADYRFRLFGTKMAQIYGDDLSGRKLSEVDAVTFEASMRADFDVVVATRTPH